MTVIAVFECPSNPDVRNGAQKNGGYCTSNYNGNMGTVIGDGSGDICDNAKNVAKPTVGCLGANGIFFPNSNVRYRDVTDGLSNTIFVSEVIDSGGDSDKLGGGGNDRKYNFSGGADSNPPTEMSEFLIAAQTDDPINAYHEEAAGRCHVGGAQFVLGDGSVRFHLRKRQHDNLSSTEHALGEKSSAISRNANLLPWRS